MPAKVQEQSGIKVVPYTPEMKAPTEQTDFYPMPIKCDKYTTVEASKKIKRTDQKVKVAKKEPKVKQSNLEGLFKKK